MGLLKLCYHHFLSVITVSLTVINKVLIMFVAYVTYNYVCAVDGHIRRIRGTYSLIYIESKSEGETVCFFFNSDTRNTSSAEQQFRHYFVCLPYVGWFLLLVYMSSPASGNDPQKRTTHHAVLNTTLYIYRNLAIT